MALLASKHTPSTSGLSHHHDANHEYIPRCTSGFPVICSCKSRYKSQPIFLLINLLDRSERCLRSFQRGPTNIFFPNKFTIGKPVSRIRDLAYIYKILKIYIHNLNSSATLKPFRELEDIHREHVHVMMIIYKLRITNKNEQPHQAFVGVPHLHEQKSSSGADTILVARTTYTISS